ncbi:MAG: hypothetical protein L0H59_03165 [Tomitella sp.]|nr:hypothetical protein [Tomitella sp.]
MTQSERSRDALVEAGILVPPRHTGRPHEIDPDSLPALNLSALLDDVRDER